jgi:PKD repeat protein
MTHTLQKIASLCFLGILLTFGSNSVKAQSTSYCVNADFEVGDFTNWQGFTGSCCPINVPNPGIVPGRHTIISAPAIDPNTCNGLQVLPAFAGGHVCRLGNDNVNAEAEQLRYDLAVDSNNALFVYRFAVVLEDPGHAPQDQPRFEIRVLDSLGNVVDPICGQYFVESGQSIPGFQTCVNSGTVWKDWTTVGINLAPYIGQNITLEFSTGDCALGGHYGYAYLDAYCMPMAIQTEFCIGATSVTLVAPPGFASYYWPTTGDSTLSTVVQNPTIGQQVTVVLSTVQNCNLNLTTTLNSTVISPNYSVQISNPCNPSASVQFTDSTTIVNGTLVGWNWNFGDASPLDTNQNPTHTFPGPNSYQVTLYAYSISGCVDSFTTTVNLFSPANAAFSNNTACVGDATNFTDQSTAGNDVITGWDWNFGDNNTSSVQNPSHTYASSGNFSVTLIIHTNNGCTDTLVQNVVVNALPVILTTPSTSICLGDASVMSASGAHTYVWSGNSLSATTGSTVTANPSATSSYTVVGTDTTTGCSSSASITITVNPLPLVVSPANPEVCAGNCAVLTLTGAVSYAWMPNNYITASNSDSSVVTTCPPATINYTVIGSSQEGCTASITFNVQVHPNPAPVITADGPSVFCAGGSVNLTVSPVVTGDIIDWSTNESTATINVNTSDVITVTITSAHGCPGTSAPMTVTVNPIPVAQITPAGPITICTGNPTILTATTGSGYSYQWYNGANQIAGATNSTYLVTASGSYSVVITASNCTATSNMVQATLGLGPAVTLTASPLIGCLQNTIYIGYGPQSVTLTATTNPPAASYLWLPDSQVTQSISVVTPGVYSVIAFDINGCPSPNPAVLSPALNVVDIRCGQGKKKIILCHVPPGNLNNPQTICIAPSAIPPHLAHHDHDCIGPCSLYYPRMESAIDVNDEDFFVLTYPNPFNNGFNLYILTASNDEVKVNIYDVLGRITETYRNVTEETLIGATLSDGMYTAEIVQGDNRKMLSIIKSNK